MMQLKDFNETALGGTTKKAAKNTTRRSTKKAETTTAEIPAVEQAPEAEKAE